MDDATAVAPSPAVGLRGLDPLTRDALRRVLAQRGFETGGHRVDVTLQGVTYDDLETVVAPDGPWVALTVTPAAAVRQAATAAGAAGVVPREAGLDELERTLRAVAAGARPASRRAARRPASGSSSSSGSAAGSDGAAAATLSRREVVVLRLLAQGASNADIAAELAISPNTARTHVQNVMGKLGVRTRLAAVAAGRSAGLV